MKRQILQLAGAILTFNAICATPTYFLITRFPSDQFKESFVVPLYDNNHVIHARELIEITKRPEWWKGPPVQPVLIVNVARGSNFINCNYATAELTEWSWHPTEVYDFIDFAMELPQFPHELEELYTIRDRREDITIAFESFTVTRELGHFPLEVRVKQSDSGLDIYWSRPGTNFLYTLQETQLGVDNAVRWTNLNDAVWPINTNHWHLNAPLKSKLFQVLARPSDPNVP